ncbi:hypothetical protein DPMN_178366 [Dreissena polymorpha]|uniref:Uncharacterized protein n=1 Tax=Dreissena polymorpha TaxID=45954 RepID=A0A9D4ILC6_DREPO|nr:hypothetical protein DPMN_178366 [Dreissena polymorpha]
MSEGAARNNWRRDLNADAKQLSEAWGSWRDSLRYVTNKRRSDYTIHIGYGFSNLYTLEKM